MALELVVVSDFEGRKRGDIISDPAEVDAVRAGEYADQTVRVSDEAIAPPPPPPPGPDFGQLQRAYQALAAAGQSTAQDLQAERAVNQQQSQTIAQQSQTIAAQDARINALAARVDAGGGTGGPAVPNPADDVPLVTKDGTVLATASGKRLVGDFPT